MLDAGCFEEFSGLLVTGQYHTCYCEVVVVKDIIVKIIIVIL
jgi:hypothetical protein